MKSTKEKRRKEREETERLAFRNTKLRGGGGGDEGEEESSSSVLLSLSSSASLALSLQSAHKIQNNHVYFCLLFYICCAVGCRIKVKSNLPHYHDKHQHVQMQRRRSAHVSAGAKTMKTHLPVWKQGRRRSEAVSWTKCLLGSSRLMKGH